MNTKDSGNMKDSLGALHEKRFGTNCTMDNNSLNASNLFNYRVAAYSYASLNGHSL